jgi:hypothetical protein
MKMKTTTLAVALLAVLTSSPASADDITGADHLLCAGARATECFSDGVCLPGEPEDWNTPRFVKIDFPEKMLRTTEASGQARSTPMKNIERHGDRIFIQGVEDSRAFSIVLDQDSGSASIAIALDSHVLAIFGYCTPIEPTD